MALEYMHQVMETMRFKCMHEYHVRVGSSIPMTSFDFFFFLCSVVFLFDQLNGSDALMIIDVYRFHNLVI
jgi:hypothetical protein